MMYGVPPAEMSIQGSDRNDDHRLYLMCEDIAAFTGDMTKHGIAFSTPVKRQKTATRAKTSRPAAKKATKRSGKK